MGQAGRMISNLSLSAFSAADLRPAASRAPDRVDGPGAPSQRPPVEPAPPIDRVRAQSEARSTLDLLTQIGRAHV